MKRVRWFYLPIILMIILSVLGYWFWTPGEKALRVEGNFQENGLWLSHGWMGDDRWFIVNKRDPLKYDSMAVEKLSITVKSLKIKYVFFHLCPASYQGKIPEISIEKLKLFRKAMPNIKIIAWIGGATETSAKINDTEWIETFCDSAIELLKISEIDGVHLNLEPLKSGNVKFLTILRKISEKKGGKLLSIAAYPPPTIWQRSDVVHWSLDYYKELSKYVDQFVPMLYDTSIGYEKIYTNLVRQWTKEIIVAIPNSSVLFGIPAYEDQGVGYHLPDVENVNSSVPGVIAGINQSNSNLKYGIAIYSEWTLDSKEIKFLLTQIPK